MWIQQKLVSVHENSLEFLQFGENVKVLNFKHQFIFGKKQKRAESLKLRFVFWNFSFSTFGLNFETKSDLWNYRSQKSQNIFEFCETRLSRLISFFSDKSEVASTEKLKQRDFNKKINKCQILEIVIKLSRRGFSFTKAALFS